MDIRNWMAGSTKKVAPQEESAHLSKNQTSPNKAKKKIEEVVIADSDDEKLKPERKRLKGNNATPIDPISPVVNTDSGNANTGKEITSTKREVAEKGTIPPSPLKPVVADSSSGIEKKCFDGMKIAVTGIFISRTREKVEEFILQNGGKIAGGVSGKTNLLVAGDRLEDGRSVEDGSKHKTAVLRNVPILTEEEFFKKYNPLVAKESNNRTVGSTVTTQTEKVVKPVHSLPVDSSLWVDKYRPKTANDLIGHGEISRKLTDWLKTWKDVHLSKKMKPPFSKENMGARAVLLSGPPGIGKTSLALMIARTMNFDVLELNASDTRNKSELDHILLEAVSSKALSTQSFFSSSSASSSAVMQVKNRVVVMDEVDGMGGSDRGGIAELIKMIKISKIPIICICNDRQSPKIRSLANNCYDLRVKRPTKGQIAQRLVQIAATEGCQVDTNAAELLVEQSGNDIRQALNALQMWSISGKQQLNYQDVKDGIRRIEKDKVLRQSPFDACLTLLEGGRQLQQGASSSSQSQGFDERYNSFFIDYSLVPLLVQQNYVDASKSGIFRNPQLDDVAKMEQLSLSSDSVSDMDMVGSRIRGLDQHWELLPTQAVFCMKVGFHIQGFQAFPSFPAWLGKYSTTTRRQRLTKEIVHHTCLSIDRGFLPVRLDYVPFLRQALLDPLLKKGKDGVSETVELLDHYDLSREDFMESLRELQFKAENDKLLSDQFERLDTQTKTALTKYYNSLSHKSSTIVQSIGAKKSKRVTVDALEEELLDEIGEVEAEGNGNPLEEDDEEDIAAIRAEMNKSLAKSKAKKNKDSLTKTSSKKGAKK